MAGNAIFPAYIKATYVEGADGIPAFNQALNESLNKAKATTQASMADIDRIISNGLSKPFTVGGGINFDVAGAQQAAQYAEARATASRELAIALNIAAASETEYAAAARISALAAERVAVDEEQAAGAARVHAQAAEYMTRALEGQAGASLRLAVASERSALSMQSSARSSGALRQASIGIGQQINDIGVSLAGGQRAATVFAQQLPQLSYALIGLEQSGSKSLQALGKLGVFLSGGWGAALTVGAIGVSYFWDQLTGTETQAAKTKAEMSRLGIAADGLGDQTLSAARAAEILNKAQLQDKTGELVQDANALAAARLRQAEATKRAATAQAVLVLAAAKSRVADLADGVVSGTTRGGGRKLDTTQTRAGSELSRETQAANIELAKAQKALTDLDSAYQNFTSRTVRQAIAGDGALRQSHLDVRTATDASAQAQARHDIILREAKIKLDAKAIGEDQYVAIVRKANLALEGTKKAEQALSSARTRGVAVMNAQASAATADEPLEKARAGLALVKAEGREQLRQGTITAEIYKSRVEAASAVVEKQEALNRSTKTGAQAADDLKRAELELDGIYADVVRRFDPATAAALEYSEALEKINKLVSAGRISLDVGERARIAATAGMGGVW
jgi:hypothetical protein